MIFQILLVDDDPRILHTYSLALMRQSNLERWTAAGLRAGRVSVLSANSYEQAVSLLASETVHLLIVDLKLRGPNGEEMGGLDVIAESIRSDRFRPIVVVTGYGSVELARDTFKRGVFDFLEKGDISADDLVDAVRRALVAREEQLVRMGNPFTRMSGVEPAVFGGRDEQLHFFEETLYRAAKGVCGHFLVLGDWGLGKSATLKEFKKICQARGGLAAIVPLETLDPGVGVSTAVRSLIEAVLRGLPHPPTRFKKVAEYFDSVGINILGSGVEVRRKEKREDLLPQAFLHDALLRLWEDLENSTDVVVILLDDLDNFASVPSFITTLKQTLSMDRLHSTRLLFGLSATPTYWNTLVSPERNHPLSRFFVSRVELNRLSAAEFRDTVLRSLSKGGVRFSDDVISQAYRFTRGHPYEMQLLCYHLFENQISREVTASVWEKALHATLVDMGLAIFRNWMVQLTPDETKLLRLFAESEECLSLDALRQMILDRDMQFQARRIPTTIQRLSERSFLRRVGRGTYEMADAMFSAYLKASDAQ